MNGEALLRHGWWSLRRRFSVAATVVVLHAAAVPLVFDQVRASTDEPGRADPGVTADVVRTADPSYDDFLRETWAGGGLGGLLTLIGVVLAVGGAPSERRRDTSDVTLSLPVPRGRWLLARAVLVVAGLVVLATGSAALVAISGVVTGAQVSLGALTGTAPLAVLGSVYAVGLAILATTCTRERVGAALLTLGVVYILGDAGSGPLGAWHPAMLSDVGVWTAGPPWASIVSASAFAGLCLVLAVARFSRVDA